MDDKNRKLAFENGLALLCERKITKDDLFDMEAQLTCRSLNKIIYLTAATDVLVPRRRQQHGAGSGSSVKSDSSAKKKRQSTTKASNVDDMGNMGAAHQQQQRQPRKAPREQRQSMGMQQPGVMMMPMGGGAMPVMMMPMNGGVMPHGAGSGIPIGPAQVAGDAAEKAELEKMKVKLAEAQKEIEMTARMNEMRDKYSSELADANAGRLSDAQRHTGVVLSAQTQGFSMGAHISSRASHSQLAAGHMPGIQAPLPWAPFMQAPSSAYPSGTGPAPLLLGGPPQTPAGSSGVQSEPGEPGPATLKEEEVRNLEKKKRKLQEAFGLQKEGSEMYAKMKKALEDCENKEAALRDEAGQLRLDYFES